MPSIERIPPVEEILEIITEGSEPPHVWGMLVVNELTEVDECPMGDGQSCSSCVGTLDAMNCPAGKKTYALLYCYEPKGQPPHIPTAVIPSLFKEEFEAAFVQYALAPLLHPKLRGTPREALCEAMDEWLKREAEVTDMLIATDLDLEDPEEL